MTISNRFAQPLRVFSVLLVAATLIGCAQAPTQRKAGHVEAQQSVSVLLMPIDIELSSLTAGGVNEVRADWTENAKELVTVALRRELAAYDDKLVEYVEPQEAADLQEHDQIIKLHEVVGETLFVHSVLPAAIPPTRQDSFDWSLGEEVSCLREASGADYGLFVYIRDSYATAGRKVMIVTSAFLGISMPGGTQLGFATLVDLSDGSVVWFNRIYQASGDLRTKTATAVTVKALMAKIPL